MLHRFVVAIGAGCAAALLFAVSAQRALLAMALAYLAPLPIMIATLGWGLDAGAIAGGDFGRRARACSPSPCRRCCSPPPSPLRPGPWPRSRSRRRAIFPRPQAGRAGRTPRSAPIVTLAALFGIARQRRGADDHHRRLRRLSRRRAPGRRSRRRPRRRRFRRRAGPTSRRANSLTRSCDLALRRSPPRRSDAVRQSLRRRSFDPAVAQSSPALARPADFACAALAAGRRVPRLRSRPPTPCPLPPPSISRSAPAGSAALWRCKGWRSRMRCRVVSRCGR